MTHVIATLLEDSLPKLTVPMAHRGFHLDFAGTGSSASAGLANASGAAPALLPVGTLSAASRCSCSWVEHLTTVLSW